MRELREKIGRIIDEAAFDAEFGDDYTPTERQVFTARRPRVLEKADEIVAILAIQGPGAEVTREELGQYFTDKRGRKAGGCFSPPQVDGCDDARPCWCKNWGLKKAATLLSQFTLHRRPPSQDTKGEGP